MDGLFGFIPLPIMDARTALMKQLSSMYRNSSLTRFALPEEAKRFDLAGVDCPACPPGSGRLSKDNSGYVCDYERLGYIFGLPKHTFIHSALDQTLVQSEPPYRESNNNRRFESTTALDISHQQLAPEREPQATHRSPVDASFTNLAEYSESQSEPEELPIRESQRRINTSSPTITPMDEAGSDDESESSEWTDVEFMFWPPKPADDYLAWPPRVVIDHLPVRHSESVYLDWTFPVNGEFRYAIYDTEPNWDYISYYDFERSIWITIGYWNKIPVLRGRPVLLRYFRLQDHQCLGWEAAVEAAGFKVVRPIRKGQQIEEPARKPKSKDHPYSRPTKLRRVSSSSSPSRHPTEPPSASRDEQEHAGSSRGRHSWWMAMPASEVIECLREMESHKRKNGRATLRQRFDQVFPGKEFALSTVKRMIAVLNQLSDEDLDHYVDEDSECSWGEVYALAKKR